VFAVAGASKEALCQLVVAHLQSDWKVENAANLLVMHCSYYLFGHVIGNQRHVPFVGKLDDSVEQAWRGHRFEFTNVDVYEIKDSLDHRCRLSPGVAKDDWTSLSSYRGQTEHTFKGRSEDQYHMQVFLYQIELTSDIRA
jgi:hypothetical protein